ncbi:MAG: hypothetical protein AVDCRST_MAG78-3307 [uncultured Rubrobacteraceae bacterium]|uniref:Uncharacterized protein n=1 Tax=uncultured Rubrobacteraceae bacterium TaxID=349277 RepID=A0A6J4QYA8_9ACTN|nr:MAG: hypothetical protein AVDCRST_MAG78-3307 [uncultured Rubrobacteraceae bacterium]
MTRRLQLLDAESRSSTRGVSAVAGRIRDGLLRDNKVVPAVLGILALLIFAWLVAGAIIGGSGDEEQQQASNQASLAQGNDSDSGDTETPAPGVENRDSDASYGGYDEGPKDPFRQIIPKADEGDDGGNQNRQGGGQDGDEDDRDSGNRDGGGGANGGRGGNDRDGARGVGGGDGGDDEDFIEQRSPNDPDSQSTPGGGAGQGGVGQDGPGQGERGQGAVGQAGGGGLFNSGGDLPVP